MAIDDNTSYELTGAQVKDLANKIKAKAGDDAFVGATSSAAGSKGLVPAPAAGDDTKFLAGDGTWKTVSSGGAIKLNLLWTGSDMLDVDTQTSVTGTTVWNGMTSGTVEVTDISAADEPSGVITSSAMLSTWHDEVYGDLTDVTYFSTVFTVRGNTTKSITYLYSTAHGWLYPVTYNIQKELTAGTNIAIAADGTISATDTTYSDFTGATSSVAGAHGLVPAPAVGDQGKVLKGDGTWGDATAKLVEMSYGESNAWAKFIAAYQAGSIVYCRASSNANPGTGSQTRKAFMAYVNNASNPTSVEFQYVRSNSSKSDSQQCDQVFVYTLTNASGGTWSVASRDMATKINVGSTLVKTYNGGANASMTLNARGMVGATSSAAGFAGVVPAPAAGDQDKVLRGDGTWAANNDPIVVWLDDWDTIELDLGMHGTATGQFMDNYTSATAVGASFFAGALSDNKPVIIRMGLGIPVPGRDWATETVRPVQVNYNTGNPSSATICFWHDALFVRATCSGGGTTWTFTKISV